MPDLADMIGRQATTAQVKLLARLCSDPAAPVWDMGTAAGLERRGLAAHISGRRFSPTPLGRAVAVLGGWTPPQKQQELLADMARYLGSVTVSNRYSLEPRTAPAGVLNDLIARGVLCPLAGRPLHYDLTERGSMAAVLFAADSP